MSAGQKHVRRRVVTPTMDQQTIDPLLQGHKSNIEFEQPNCLERTFVSNNKIKWYWAPAFLLFWIFLYYAIAIPAYHSLPKPLNIKDEAMYPERFIAERAELNLQKLIELGPRVVGSRANERGVTKYFLSSMQKMRTAFAGVNDIDADVQVASGSYIHWQMINMYQSIQNFIIKVSAKNTNSTTYLLVNSHYDSVPGGPGAGDDGAMVAIMLETIRVLVTSKQALKNPVVFLFNGAEENPLQASHAFITQHKWAKNCKAVINLDSAGSGGREILFQSGPNHPWLMKHYRRAAMHPYASSVAEEMFQRHFIPSDTDFRIFRDHGAIPGLDMAHQTNGYVYHTRYDRPELIPRGSLQNTGDNVLALVRELANSVELENAAQYAQGHTVFYDVMGCFLIIYTETEGIILNVIVALAAIGACCYSFRLMAEHVGIPVQDVLRRALYMFILQIFAVLAAALLCFFVGIFMDLVHLSMSWFTQSWLILGLYFCPLFFGFAIVPALYFHWTADDHFPIGHRVQLLLHSHCLFLAALTLLLTICSIRSAFIFMVTILFYSTALIINLSTRLHNKEIAWLVPHIICCIPPFLFYAYASHGFFVTFIPMTGRFGAGINPDLLICAFTVGVGLLTGGFMIPTLNLFHKSKTIICCFWLVTLLCFIIACTPLGFPYRPETNVQRFSVLHTKRIFHDADNNIRRAESGYFILPQDRHTYSVKKHVINMTLAQPIDKDCLEEMLCGLPLYNHRWHKARASSLWIPAPEPIFSTLPALKILSKNTLTPTKVRFEFQLNGPDHMGIFIRPLNGASITNWSFHYTPLRLNWPPPFFVYFSYGVNSDPLKFWLELEKPSGAWNTSTMEIGISGHWNHHDELLTADFRKFLNSFPAYVDASAWPASYESWHF